MLESINTYKEIDHSTLKSHLKYFLEQIVPVCEENNIKLALHPDDPPFDIFGLPRIVSAAEDVEYILSSVDNSANGFCFCTGSFGASAKNNLVEMIKRINTRIHFVHLRNTRRDECGNFYEANHLDGDTDMYAVVKELLSVQQKLDEPIPFRPDHGHVMLDDINKKTNPGYSCIGRMRGLAELRGLMLGISRANNWQ
jgi:mannonate dehydratase